LLRFSVAGGRGVKRATGVIPDPAGEGSGPGSPGKATGTGNAGSVGTSLRRGRGCWTSRVRTRAGWRDEGGPFLSLGGRERGEKKDETFVGGG